MDVDDPMLRRWFDRELVPLIDHDIAARITAGYTPEKAEAAARESFKRVVNRALDELDGAKRVAIAAMLHTLSERSEAPPAGHLPLLLSDFAMKAVDELERNGMDEHEARAQVAEAFEYSARTLRRPPPNLADTLADFLEARLAVRSTERHLEQLAPADPARPSAEGALERARRRYAQVLDAIERSRRGQPIGV